MGLIGKKVQHNKFGEGLITEQDASYVSVKFMSEPETKRFQYPSCFKTFLKLLDADAAVKTDEAVKRYVTIFLHRKATLFPVWKQELRFVQSRGKQ